MATLMDTLALRKKVVLVSPGGTSAEWHDTGVWEEAEDSHGYLAADSLDPVQSIQGLLRIAQVLLQLCMQDTHGKGDHGAWN